MIPKTKLWRFRVRSKHGRILSSRYIWAPTRALARMMFARMYPRYWGFPVTVWRVPDSKTDYSHAPEYKS